MDENKVKQIKKDYMLALESKRDELLFFNYKDVTVDTVFDCIINHVWKRRLPERAHLIASDILCLKPTVYMSYITTQTHTVNNDDLLASIEAVTSQQNC